MAEAPIYVALNRRTEEIKLKGEVFMGLSLLSCLEIYGNKDRIVIDVGGPIKEGEHKGKYWS